jgi:hypothetical protein
MEEREKMVTVNKKEELQNIIAHATGTTAYHRYSPIPVYPVITDGVLAAAEAAGCFWLLDIIGSYQGNIKLDTNFQVWTLTVKDDKSAVVKGFNDTTLIIRQKIKYTDFPLKEFKLYLIRGVILLPNEY